MTADLVNGLFEIGGGLLLTLNVRKLWRERTVAGVSALPVIFFTAWGLWNLWFYPAVACWWSFAGGLAVVIANAAWLGLLAWIRWRPCPDPRLYPSVRFADLDASSTLADPQELTPANPPSVKSAIANQKSEISQ